MFETNPFTCRKCISELSSILVALRKSVLHKRKNCRWRGTSNIVLKLISVTLFRKSFSFFLSFSKPCTPCNLCMLSAQWHQFAHQSQPNTNRTAHLVFDISQTRFWGRSSFEHKTCCRNHEKSQHRPSKLCKESNSEMSTNKNTKLLNSSKAFFATWLLPSKKVVSIWKQPSLQSPCSVTVGCKPLMNGLPNNPDVFPT